MNSVGFYGVFFNEDLKNIAKEFWQHTGMGISSRFAEAIVSGKDLKSLAQNGILVKQAIKERISSYLDSNHVYLFPSGMNFI